MTRDFLPLFFVEITKEDPHPHVPAACQFSGHIYQAVGQPKRSKDLVFV
jgi:hypothetical protein